MEEKNKHKETDFNKKKLEEKTNLSSTIKNAHASGDGSIKRSDEAIDTPKEGGDAVPQKGNSY